MNIELADASAGSLVVWIRPAATVEITETDFTEPNINWHDLGKGIFAGPSTLNEGHYLAKFRRKSGKGLILNVLELRPSQMIILPACKSCSGLGQVPGAVGVRTCLACDGYGYSEHIAAAYADQLPDDELKAFYSRVIGIQAGVTPERDTMLEDIRFLFHAHSN